MLPQRWSDTTIIRWPYKMVFLIPDVPQTLVQEWLEQGYENSFVLKYLQGHQIFQMILIFIHQILPKHLFLDVLSSSFTVQVKSAPLLMGQNACAERGVLPRSSDTLRVCWCSMFLS